LGHSSFSYDLIAVGSLLVAIDSNGDSPDAPPDELVYVDLSAVQITLDPVP